MTFGFFGGNTTASRRVNKRASNGKAQDCALYLFFFYAGLSIGNTTRGFFWSADGWSGVIRMISTFALGILVLTLLIASLSEKDKGVIQEDVGN